MTEQIKLVRDIFEASGMKLGNKAAEGYDFSAEDIKLDYVVAVKMSKGTLVGIQQIDQTIRELIRAADREEKTPVLVVSAVMHRHQEYLKQYTSLVVIDIQNLLYMVRSRPQLKLRLQAMLEYSVDLLLPEKPKLSIEETILLTSPDEPEYEDSDEIKERHRLKGLIDLLTDWDNVASNSVAYEHICCDVLKTLFADDLALWKSQQAANDGLFRFDMICKIKNGNEKEFWNMSERYFGAKYIVFEFKNYSNQIGQREVFTTVKYLYTKALRGVAVLVSTKGVDVHGERAIRGILRDEGKLILSLSNRDLVQMLKMKLHHDDPADYLSDKLDQLLIDLEK